MRYTTSQLIKHQNHDNHFHETLDFSSVLKGDDDLLAIGPVTVEGTYDVEDNSYYHFTLTIETTLTLACAKTLKPVDYPVSIEVEETFSADKNDEYLNIEGLTIDLYPVIWSNIYLEKPMRIIHPDAQDLSFDEPSTDDEPIHPAFKELAKYKK